ncbi:hypothetical protein Acsp04_57870 [Actinomadura sp. NBRC 104425]|uniref:ester cyclase n=1 Tax=Actinomadura sp. NBRC 104425 TaxID=3032204 RepID=UPI0024A4442A|nr:ester cyclase [Actinomadura sp. NBRC 104425]GLZ15552.1 hypothetical protein Acsp04_57870 [Actinomadura sp. NBRC 104425]
MQPEQIAPEGTALKEVAYAPYRDPEEFIVEWTDRIWVRRGIGLIRENYAADAVVHGAYGTVRGVEPVVSGTLQKINAFPDRVGQADDVVWEARGDDAFVSSHRVFSAGTHTGMSHYGPPTHRPFTSRTIATCLYRRGVMQEEWVVRDELAVVQALGLDPDAIARDLAFAPGGVVRSAPPESPLTCGDSGPRPDGGAAFRGECEHVLELIEQVWNGRRLDRVTDWIARDVTCHTAGHRDVIRPDGYQRALLDLLAPFPGARIEIRDVAANHSAPHGGVRVAVVWVLRGVYDGIPRYGRPTGSPVDVLGASQFLFRDGRVVREWRIYDEIAIRAQIAHARGDEPSP